MLFVGKEIERNPVLGRLHQSKRHVSALSNRQRFESSDVEQIRRYVGDLFGPHKLAVRDATSLRFRHYSASLCNVTFNILDYGAELGSISINSAPVSEYYLAQITLAGHCEVNQGCEAVQLSPGMLFLIDPDRPLMERMTSDYVHMMLRIRRSSLQEALSRDLGFTIESPVVFTPYPQPLTGDSTSLLRLISTVCDDLNSSTAGFTQKKVAQNVEATLLSLLLNTVPHNFSGYSEKTYRAPMPYYMRRALNYITSNLCKQITLTHLVEVSGVSARSLHACFRQHKNTTPMNYLKACRLDFARRELVNAEKRGLSITDVALNCGFNHLSKFARDYRIRFGETPSQTRSGRGGR